MTCTHHLGSLPCTNEQPHQGEFDGSGRGCVHHGTSVDDGRHDDRTENQ